MKVKDFEALSSDELRNIVDSHEYSNFYKGFAQAELAKRATPNMDENTSNKD